MKAIVIQETKDGTGYTASVVGMRGYQCIDKDEITALKHLAEKLERINPHWINRPMHDK